jgi:transglutaminase-like putative cysteine protease
MVLGASRNILPMNRRSFLIGALAPVAAGRSAFAQDDGWRTFEVTTRVEVQGGPGRARAWLPLAHAPADRYQRVIKQSWRGSAETLRALRDERTGTGILLAEWPDGVERRDVELTLQIATRDRAVDWRDRTVRGAPSPSLARYLQPSRLLPLDGIVRETARKITGNETDDVAKARAIYEWIVANTQRDPKVRGCGIGDIRAMLTTGNLRGKCADLNALFVGLARSSGIPARDVYGIRVGPSRRFTSLGRSGDVTSAQHCRAEFHSRRHGWVPVDPADVRTVILEEKPGLDLSSPDVQYARRQLFGSWEGNWIAFNDTHDVALPKSLGPTLPFLMYPQAEVSGKRLDALNADAFRYRIIAREIT